MKLKLTYFITSIIIVILLIITLFITIDFSKQNKDLISISNELNKSIDEYKNVINKIEKEKEGLEDNIVQLNKNNNNLKNDNNKLQKNNEFLNLSIQELSTQITELKKEIEQLEEDKKQAEKNEIVTPIYKDFKSYLPHVAITYQPGKQWQLQQIATTNQDGIRCIDGIPMVAVGTGWGLSVGDIAMVTCDNGNSFKVMIGDIKDDSHTDAENKTTVASGCRCEFIVELEKLDPYVRMMGSLAVLKKYSGYVINIEKIV